MSTFVASLLEEAGHGMGVHALSHRPWVFVCAKAGRNAVFKVMVPVERRAQGYVLHVARHADTPVIERETSILERLHATLPPDLAATLPTLIHVSRFLGHPYFVVPYRNSFAPRGVRARLLRKGRIKWLCEWTTALGVHTRGPALDAHTLFQNFSAEIHMLECERRIDRSTATQIRHSLDRVCDHASRIPSVCCHGDLSWENILWSRDVRRSVIIDWGAAQWPGLPAVDLCRFVLHQLRSTVAVRSILSDYCRALGFDLDMVRPLFDLYDVFVESELHTAFRDQLPDRPSVFSSGLPSQRLATHLS